MLGHNKSAITQLRSAFGAIGSQSAYNLATSLAIPFSNFFTSWVPGQIYPFDGPNTYCGNLTSQGIVYPALNNKKTISAARDVIRNGGYGKETDSLLNIVVNWFGNSRHFLPSADDNYADPFDWLGCTENPMIFTSYSPGTQGYPEALPVASRLLTVEQPLENCRKTYNFSKTWQPNLDYYKRFGGFNMSYPRLAISTGQIDMWRPATALAEFTSLNKPNSRVKSKGTMSEPQIIIEGGSHEWDLPGLFPNETTAKVPPQAVKSAHQREIAIFKQWLEEWKTAHPSA